MWLFLDLESRVQAGSGANSSVELAVRAAASIAAKSLGENRAVGLTAYGHRMAVLPADRGGRQYLKMMQLLAAVDGDGVNPLVEGLLSSLPRLRRGMTAVVITPSLDRSWVRPLASLRGRGIAAVVMIGSGQLGGHAGSRSPRQKPGRSAMRWPSTSCGRTRSARTRRSAPSSPGPADDDPLAADPAPARRGLDQPAPGLRHGRLPGLVDLPIPGGSWAARI